MKRWIEDMQSFLSTVTCFRSENETDETEGLSARLERTQKNNEIKHTNEASSDEIQE